LGGEANRSTARIRSLDEPSIKASDEGKKVRTTDLAGKKENVGVFNQPISIMRKTRWGRVQLGAGIGDAEKKQARRTVSHSLQKKIK